MLSRPGRLAFDGAPRPNLKALNLKRQTSSSLVRPPLLSSNKDGTRSRARADTVEKASISALIIGPIQIIAPHSPSSFFVRPARSPLSLSHSHTLSLLAPDFTAPIFIISFLLSFAAGKSRDSLPDADAAAVSVFILAVTTSVVVVVDRPTYRGVASFAPSANERTNERPT